MTLLSGRYNSEASSTVFVFPDWFLINGEDFSSNNSKLAFCKYSVFDGSWLKNIAFCTCYVFKSLTGIFSLINLHEIVGYNRCIEVYKRILSADFKICYFNFFVVWINKTHQFNKMPILIRNSNILKIWSIACFPKLTLKVEVRSTRSVLGLYIPYLSMRFQMLCRSS